LYEKWCVACHAAGPGQPGTLRLSVDRSPAQSVLVERHDLTVDYISTIVRVGFGFMPPFRATELTDPEVAAVSRFITSQAAASRGATGK
jgi:mono/diheme cytochrome c family protein